MNNIKQTNSPTKNQTRFGVPLGFTLVELIVVVTILAILATIGFVSYSSYLTGVRDTNRLAQLVAIHDGMELYRTKNDLPLPDENISIMASGAIIAYQGYAGSNTLETIDFTKGGKDPKDGDYFSYYLTQDRKYFQLLAFLEEEENLSASAVIPSPGRGGLGRGIVNAADLSNRISTVYGKKLGVMTDSDNTPIQELVSGSIDLVDDDTTGYVAHLTDTSTLTGSTAGNSDLAYLENTGIGGGMAASCKTIIDRTKNVLGKNGTYIIDPEGGSPLPIYCDMTTDGGGWTALVRINASINNSTYWGSNPGTKIGDHYNYLNLSTNFSVEEIYVNNAVGFDGGEYLFQKEGSSLYARRGTLKDVELTATWTGIRAGGTLSEWLMGTYYTVNTIPYIGHNNVPLGDFPFYDNNATATSDSGFGGRGYSVNEDAYIFVR